MNPAKEDCSDFRDLLTRIALANKETLENRLTLHEEAITTYPDSYKLWISYLTLLESDVRNSAPASLLEKRVHIKKRIEEDCLSRPILRTLPYLWVRCAAVYQAGHMLTDARHLFDRSLLYVPLTQHNILWQAYSNFVRTVSDVSVQVVENVLYRHMLFDVKAEDQLLSFYVREKKWNEAWGVVTRKESRLDPFAFLRQTEDVPMLDVVVQYIQKRASHEQTTQSQLEDIALTACAYYVRNNMYDATRDILELILDRVTTIPLFTKIFHAYCALEEAYIEHNRCQTSDLNRYEHLLKRYGELKNAVAIRRNPSSSQLWLARIALVGEDDELVERTFVEALTTVTEDVVPLWIHFARWYEEHGDVTSAGEVYERALSTVESIKLDDYAILWCSYAEMLVRCEDYRGAIGVLRRATATNVLNVNSVKVAELSAKDRTWMSARVWNLYVDLNESVSSPEATIECYERMMQLKVGSAKQITNYAEYLMDIGRKDKSFAVFGRGVERFPKDTQLWFAYVHSSVTDSTIKSPEVIRDLFEHCLTQIPLDPSDENVIKIFTLYAQFEKVHGLSSQCLSVYRRYMEVLHSSPVVTTDQKLTVLAHYLSQSIHYFGPTSCRAIFQHELAKTVTRGDDLHYVSTVCLWFAKLEVQLGDIDRARAVYVHGSSCLPQGEASHVYWKSWSEFETTHGDIDTTREMQRIWKRWSESSGGDSKPKKRDRENY